MSAIPFVCDCGQPVPTLRAWERWPFVGHQSVPADDDEPELHLEYRNCPRCNTTKVIEVDRARLDAPPKGPRAKRDPDARERAAIAFHHAIAVEKALDHELNRHDAPPKDSTWYAHIAALAHDASAAWSIAADAAEEAGTGTDRYARHIAHTLAEQARSNMNLSRRMEQLDARQPYSASKRSRSLNSSRGPSDVLSTSSLPLVAWARKK